MTAHSYTTAVLVLCSKDKMILMYLPFSPGFTLHTCTTDRLDAGVQRKGRAGVEQGRFLRGQTVCWGGKIVELRWISQKAMQSEALEQYQSY